MLNHEVAIEKYKKIKGSYTNKELFDFCCESHGIAYSIAVKLILCDFELAQKICAYVKTIYGDKFHIKIKPNGYISKNGRVCFCHSFFIKTLDKTYIPINSEIIVLLLSYEAKNVFFETGRSKKVATYPMVSKKNSFVVTIQSQNEAIISRLEYSDKREYCHRQLNASPPVLENSADYYYNFIYQ